MSSSSCSSSCFCSYGIFCVIDFALRELKRSIVGDWTAASIAANIDYIRKIYPEATHEEVGFFVLKIITLILAGDKELNMSIEEKLSLFSSIMDEVDFWGEPSDNDVKDVAFFCLIIATGNTEKLLEEYPIDEKKDWEERQEIRLAAEAKVKETLEQSLAHRCKNYGGTWVWSLVRVWWDAEGKIIFIDSDLPYQDVGHWTDWEIRTETELLDRGVGSKCPDEIMSWRR